MLYEANEGTFCPKYSVRSSEVCSSTQLIFSHSLKQTIKLTKSSLNKVLLLLLLLTFDKLCINLIEFNHFATDFAKNLS